MTANPLAYVVAFLAGYLAFAFLSNSFLPKPGAAHSSQRKKFQAALVVWAVIAATPLALSMTPAKSLLAGSQASLPGAVLAVFGLFAIVGPFWLMSRQSRQKQFRVDKQAMQFNEIQLRKAQHQQPAHAPAGKTAASPPASRNVQAEAAGRSRVTEGQAPADDSRIEDDELSLEAMLTQLDEPTSIEPRRRNSAWPPASLSTPAPAAPVQHKPQQPTALPALPTEAANAPAASTTPAVNPDVTRLQKALAELHQRNRHLQQQLDFAGQQQSTLQTQLARSRRTAREAVNVARKAALAAREARAIIDGAGSLEVRAKA